MVIVHLLAIFRKFGVIAFSQVMAHDGGSAVLDPEGSAPPSFRVAAARHDNENRQ
jgi:hypothetical protein